MNYVQVRVVIEVLVFEAIANHNFDLVISIVNNDVLYSVFVKNHIQVVEILDYIAMNLIVVKDLIVNIY